VLRASDVALSKKLALCGCMEINKKRFRMDNTKRTMIQIINKNELNRRK